MIQRMSETGRERERVGECKGAREGERERKGGKDIRSCASRRGTLCQASSFLTVSMAVPHGPTDMFPEMPVWLGKKKKGKRVQVNAFGFEGRFVLNSF